MEVEMVGFMCYRKAKFSFPASGITLLKGPSGKGKTTILRAIMWCLFGNMRNVDQKTNRKGKLSVTIRTFIKGGKECVIYRQKRPNILKFRVGRFEQVDAVAQSKINEIYGSEKMWLLCSYLKQKKSNRLFEVPGSEKLELLNKIAFHESDPTPYISKIEDLLKEEKLRFELLQEDFSKECAALSQYLETHYIQLADAIPEEEMKRLKEELNNLNDEISDLRQRHIRHREAFSALQVLDDRIADLQRKSKQLETDQENEVKEDEILILEEQIKDIERQIEAVQRFEQQTRSLKHVKDKLNSLEEKYKEYDKIELCTEKDLYEIQTQHDKFQQNEDKAKKCGVPYDSQHIEKELLFLTALLKMQPALKIHRNVLQLHEKILSFTNTEDPESIEATIQKQQEKIYVLKQGKSVLSCPECGHHVRYIKGSLESCDHKPSTEKEFNEASEELAKLQKALQSQKERQNLLDQFTNLTKIYEEEISSITTSDLEVLGKSGQQLLSPSELEKHKTKHLLLHSIEFVTKPDREISEIRSGVEKGKLESERNRCLEEVEFQEKEWYRLQSECEVLDLKDLHHQRSLLQQRLQKYRTYLSLCQSIQKDLDIAQQQKSEALSQLEYGLEKEIDAREEKLKTIQKRIENAIRANEAVEKQKVLSEKRQSVVELSQKVYHLERLKGISIDVECKVLQQTVDSINATINVLAETIFEEPIRVELKLYRKLKTTKKIKPMVNVQIRHKGGIYENPSEVSGGEEDRLSLLLTLALSRLSGSPLLLIDETFSGLDDDLKVQCLRAIRSVTPGKAVICVDHASIEGYYDQVLNIGN